MTSPTSVYIVEDAMASICALAIAAEPFETGGLIVGVTTADSLWITRFLEVAVAKRHRSRFLIPAGATHPVIDDARTEDPRVGYLGDWHSHPVDVGPSSIDFSTLVDLAVGSLGHRRLLGLVRPIGPSWTLELWSVNRFRRPRRAEYQLTGPVPPPGDAAPNK
ncbi:MAG: Mov34/MPN/PAD-1 family protein [Chloroflexi bacterium]|nr:Mov34/MPN/PAD-1 family protein [Chloroflexota bacterium]